MWSLRPRPQRTRNLLDACNMERTAALVLAIVCVALPISQGLVVEVRNFNKRIPQASLLVCVSAGDQLLSEALHVQINKYVQQQDTNH